MPFELILIFDYRNVTAHPVLHGNLLILHAVNFCQARRVSNWTRQRDALLHRLNSFT